MITLADAAILAAALAGLGHGHGHVTYHEPLAGCIAGANCAQHR
jgi:hypothetical protein